MMTVEEFERNGLELTPMNLFVKIKVEHFGYRGEMVIVIQNWFRGADVFYNFIVNYLDQRRDIKYSLEFDENIKHCIHASSIPELEVDDMEENVRFKQFGGIRVFHENKKSAIFKEWQFDRYITGFEIIGFEKVELEDEKEN